MRPELVEYIENYTDEIEIAFQRKHRFLKAAEDLKKERKTMDKRKRRLAELFVMSTVYDTFLDKELFPSAELSGEALERAKENEQVAALLLNEIQRTTRKIGSTQSELTTETGQDIGFAPINISYDPGRYYIERVSDFGTREMYVSVWRAVADADDLEDFERYMRWKAGRIFKSEPSLGGENRPLMKDHEYIAKLLGASKEDIEKLYSFKVGVGEFVTQGAKRIAKAAKRAGPERKSKLVSKGKWIDPDAPSAYPAFLTSVYEDILDAKRIDERKAEDILSRARAKHLIHEDDWVKYKPIMIALLTTSQYELNRAIFIQDIGDETVKRMINHLVDKGKDTDDPIVSTFITESTRDIKAAVTAKKVEKIGDDLVGRAELLRIFTKHSDRKGAGIVRMRKLNLEESDLKALVEATYYQDMFKGQSTRYEKEFDEIISLGTNRVRGGIKCSDQRAKLEDVKTTFDEIEKGAKYGINSRKFEKDKMTLQRMKTKIAKLEKMNKILGDEIDTLDPLFLTI